jgi:hypothetical protein
LAWSASAIRKRALEDMQAGVLDKVGYWQTTGQANWQGLKARLESEPPQLQGGAGSPPKRTRQSIPANGKAKAPIPT